MEKQLSDVKNTVVMELDYTVPNLWAFFTRNQSQYITKLIFSQKLAGSFKQLLLKIQE